MYLNRTVAIVNLKAPFLGWLNTIPDHPQLTAEDLEAHAHVVLLPDETLDDNNMASEVVSEYWLKIAEHVFGEWIVNESLWPKDFSIDTFNQWFDLAIIDSPVGDLVDGPLGRYELADEDDFEVEDTDLEEEETP